MNTIKAFFSIRYNAVKSHQEKIRTLATAVALFVSVVILSSEVRAATLHLEITRVSDTQGIVSVVDGDIGSVTPTTQGWIFTLRNPYASAPSINTHGAIMTSSTMSVGGEVLNNAYYHNFPAETGGPAIYFTRFNTYPNSAPLNSEITGSFEFTLPTSTLAPVGSTGEISWGISLYANPVAIGSWTMVSNTPDSDGDTVSDDIDNCPDHYNPLQENNDGDTEGDVCDNDDDNDSIADLVDNCPLISNIFQEDDDFDGLGNACDSSYDAGFVAQHVDDEAVAVVNILTALNVSGGNGIISKLTGDGSVTQKVSDAVINFGVSNDLDTYLSDLAAALNQLDAVENQVDSKANKKKGISDPELTQIYAGIDEIRLTIEGLILAGGETL